MIADNHPELAELAALYAAGAMPPDEAARFEQRLVSEEACQRELARLDPVLAELFLACPGVTPSPHVRVALLSRAAPPLFIRRQLEGNWHGIGVPGVDMRVLYRDRTRRLVTFLLRMAPSTELPAHPHHGVEECYIVEGDVHSLGVNFHAGDYFRAEAGTHHGPSRTVGGCLLLVQAPDAEGFEGEG
jgi:quercetin dioxygenase-like cupin family protein